MCVAGATGERRTAIEEEMVDEVRAVSVHSGSMDFGPVDSGKMMRRARQGAGVLLTLWGVMMPSQAKAQVPTDTSVQSSPTTAPPKAVVVDGAVQASPALGAAGIKAVQGKLAAGTALPIKLSEAVDSGKLKNGGTVEATLTGAVQAENVTVPSGTKVTVTVVGAVPANKMSSAGEMSLQVVKVGEIGVYCDTQTFKGKEGHKDVADSAPEKGTDAKLAVGAELTFKVLPAPVMAPGR